MKFALHSVVLLPALLLPFVVAQARTCSNGLAGYEVADVCCPLSCGQCGGPGCRELGEGCCIRAVKESGALCSATRTAPCNIDNRDATDDYYADNYSKNEYAGDETSSPAPSAGFMTFAPTPSTDAAYGTTTAGPTTLPAVSYRGTSRSRRKRR